MRLDRVARVRVAGGAAEVEEVGVNEGDYILAEIGCLERDRCREREQVSRRTRHPRQPVPRLRRASDRFTGHHSPRHITLSYGAANIVAMSRRPRSVSDQMDRPCRAAPSSG